MKGVNKFDLIIIGGFTLINLIVGGFFYYTTFVFQKPLMSNDKLTKELTDPKENAQFRKGITLKRFVVNLPSNRKRLRFLEVNLNVLPIKEEDSQKIESLLPQLRDVVINTVGGMNAEELNSIAGKILLEERIKRKFREKSKKNLIAKIFYTRFVVQ